MNIKIKMRSVAVTTISTLLLSLTISINGQVVTSSPPEDLNKPKGAVLKGKVPVNKEILNVKFPKAQEATLSNGMRVILLPSHKVPTFGMQMIFLSGGLSDPANLRGVSQFTASMLREGTTKRTTREIAEQMEALGSTFNTGSGPSGFVTNVAASGLMENFDRTLDIFTDLVRNPLFSAEEFEKLKTRTLNQMQLQRTIPGLIAQERFQRATYGNHPAGILLPPAEAVKQMTANDLKQFHQTYYRPNNAILAITGDITIKELMPKLERMFGDWQKADVPATQIPPVQELSKAGIYLIDRPNSVQTTLLLGSLGIDRKHPDYYALQVLNEVFGGSPAARLFMNLREDKGYTYGVNSAFSASKYPGVVFASSSVRTEVTEGALKEFMYELKRIRDEKVSATELENAKRSLIGSFALSLEQPTTLLGNMLTLRLYDFPDNYWDVYPQKITTVTADEVQRVAQKYYSPSRLQIIAVGDASKIRETLAKYGAVETYNTEGKLIATVPNNP